MFPDNEINYPGAEYTLQAFESMVFNTLLTVQIFFYLIYSLIILRNYRAEIKRLYSSVENINLIWILFIIGAFTLMWLLDTCLSIIILTGINNHLLNNILFSLAILTNFTFAIYIVYKGLKQSDTFSGIKNNNKYKSSKLTESDSNRYHYNLHKYISEYKPYLNPNLTIKELSEKTDIPSRLLSQIINERLKQNFFDFINMHRIEEAKRILISNTDPKQTILEVLYECGFNSKSAFNAAFKKYTGLTPTKFKNSIITR